MGRWEEVDEPVLRAVFELKEEALAKGAGVMTIVDERDLAARTGLWGGRLADSLAKLSSEGFIEAVDVGFESVVARGVTPSGLRALGEWPGEEALSAALPDLLLVLAERVVEETTREALMQAAETTRDFSVEFVSAAIGEVVAIRR